MLKLSNIRIPVRIAIACLLPLLAFTGFAGKELLDRRSVAADMDAIGVVAKAAPIIAEAVHELQRERGYSVGYIELERTVTGNRDERSAAEDRQGTRGLE